MPVTSDELRAYQNKVKELQKETAGLSREVEAEVKKIVDDSRKNIKELIDTYPAKEPLPSSAVTPLKQKISSEIDSMIAQVSKKFETAQSALWSSGISAAQNLAQTMNLNYAFFTPSTNLLAIAIGHTADLVRSISSDLMPKVNGVLSRSALGRLSPYEAMQEIDGLMGRAGGGGVSWQVESIVRTEVQTMYSVALDTSVQELIHKVDNPKKLTKTWKSGPNRKGRRPGHQEMDGQTVPVDEPFKNPETGAKLMYPRDPAADASERVACGCGYIINADSIMNAME